MVEDINALILHEYRTRLAGGFDEPFYRAPSNDRSGEIQFTRDYLRSALHELAHWCAAEAARRKTDDYGYWYAPDGRSEDQQNRFFRVEVLPQALENCFCAALGIRFQVSCDNLDGAVTADAIETFAELVARKKNALESSGLPTRARRVLDVCTAIGANASTHVDARPGAPGAAPDDEPAIASNDEPREHPDVDNIDRRRPSP